MSQLSGAADRVAEAHGLRSELASLRHEALVLHRTGTRPSSAQTLYFNLVSNAQPSASAHVTPDELARLRHEVRVHRVNNNKLARDGRPSCSVEFSLGCNCTCSAGCTLLHYIPIPKTASEATKLVLARHLANNKAEGGAPRCAGHPLCYAAAGTHAMNARLPPLPPLLAGPLSPTHSPRQQPTQQPTQQLPRQWWHRCGSGATAAQATPTLRVATVRNPFERFYSTFDADAPLLRAYGVPATIQQGARGLADRQFWARRLLRNATAKVPPRPDLATHRASPS